MLPPQVHRRRAGATRDAGEGHRRTPSSISALIVFVAAAAVGCGGGGANAARAACTTSDKDIVRTAVTAYINRASPTPQRFLTAAGTDSALPEGGVLALQDKGPTYFYLSDPRHQKEVRDKLDQVGAYASLLVTFHGLTRDSSGAPVVTLGGDYVSGKYDGKVAPKRVIRFRCDSTGWTVASSDSVP